MSKPETVPLTWDDLAERAGQLEPAERDLLLEVVKENGQIADRGTPAGDGWFLKDVWVRGHVGIGEDGLRLQFPEATGLTVVSARNGVGKTSAVDAVRHVMSSGQPRKYELAERNLHCPGRSIVVTVTNGRYEVQLTCDGDGEVRWRPSGGPEGPPPADWSEAFEWYRPVLLYPEISPVIESQKGFHEFLKGALDLSTLEELRDELNAIRKSGRDAGDEVEEAHQAAAAAMDGFDGDTFRDHLTGLGAVPSAPDTEAFRSAVAAALPCGAPAPDLVGAWETDDRVVDQVAEGVTRLRVARAGVVEGVDAVQEALGRLLAEPGRHVADLRDQDLCPVCGTRGATWFATATTEHERLATMLRDVRGAEADLTAHLSRFQACLPPALPPVTRTALAESAQPGEYLDMWDRLATARAGLTLDGADDASIQALHAESTALLDWYQTTQAEINSAHHADAERHAQIRKCVEAWYESLARNRATIDRAAVADRLLEKTKGWIRRARDEIFAPIEKEIIGVWGNLNSDSDVQMTSLKLAGGVQKAQKVALGLTLGEVPVPGTNGHAVLSTGQRNALSLATYLPRATQDASPFRFLVLDDPIHAFDDWRVRYLARHLADLAARYQIIVFTHDDRLWHALKALGHRPRHLRLDRPSGGASHVRAFDITYPSDHLFEEIEGLLNGEAGRRLGQTAACAATTLALCRQAVDIEAATQVEIMGRRAGKSEEEIRAGLDDAVTTSDQLELLNAYAVRAEAGVVDLPPYKELLRVLNGAAHGFAPEPVTLEQCRQWLRESRQLAAEIRGLSG